MEKLNGNMNAKNKDRQNSGKKNKELIKREQVEDSPFEIVTTNKQVFIGMGNYRLSENLEQEYKSELIRRINEKDWNLILATVHAQIDAKERFNKMNNEKETKITETINN